MTTRKKHFIFLAVATVFAVTIVAGYVFINSQKLKEVASGPQLNQSEIENIIETYAKIKNNPDTKPLDNRVTYPVRGVQIGFSTLGGGYQKNIDLEKAVMTTRVHDDVKNKDNTEIIYLNEDQLTKIVELLNVIWKARISELVNHDIQCNDLYNDFTLTDGDYSKSLHYWCPIENKTVNELDDYVRSIK